MKESPALAFRCASIGVNDLGDERMTDDIFRRELDDTDTLDAIQQRDSLGQP